MDRGRSAHLARTVRQPHDFSITLSKRFLTLETGSAVSLMQMQPLDALWGTKFYRDQSHWPLLIVQSSSLLIRSNNFSKLLETGKNKNICYTFGFTWSTTNAYKSPRFSVLCGPTCILISPRIVSLQIVVINYQNITKGPRWFTCYTMGLYKSNAFRWILSYSSSLPQIPVLR
jgi:hypothetical protein